MLNYISWDKEINLLRLAIKSINNLKPKPKFFIVCGDLVDAFPRDKEMKKAQIKDLKLVLEELDSEIKTICVCGNHDIGNKVSIYIHSFIRNLSINRNNFKI